MISLENLVNYGELKHVGLKSIQTGKASIDRPSEVLKIDDSTVKNTAFVCSAFLIAECPGLLQKLFGGSDALNNNRQEAKRILVYIRSEKKIAEAVVEPYFLADSITGRLPFYSLKSDSYWPLYLERALPNSGEVSYEHFSSYDPSDYLECFTGCSTLEIQLLKNNTSGLQFLFDCIIMKRMATCKLSLWSKNTVW